MHNTLDAYWCWIFVRRVTATAACSSVADRPASWLTANNKLCEFSARRTRFAIRNGMRAQPSQSERFVRVRNCALPLLLAVMARLKDTMSDHLMLSLDASKWPECCSLIKISRIYICLRSKPAQNEWSARSRWALHIASRFSTFSSFPHVPFRWCPVVPTFSCFPKAPLHVHCAMVPFLCSAIVRLFRTYAEVKWCRLKANFARNLARCRSKWPFSVIAVQFSSQLSTIVEHRLFCISPIIFGNGQIFAVEAIFDFNAGSVFHRSKPSKLINRSTQNWLVFRSPSLVIACFSNRKTRPIK